MTPNQKDFVKTNFAEVQKSFVIQRREAVIRKQKADRAAERKAITSETRHRKKVISLVKQIETTLQGLIKCDPDFRKYLALVINSRGHRYDDRHGCTGFVPPPLKWRDLKKSETEKAVTQFMAGGKVLVGSDSDYTNYVSILSLYSETNGSQGPILALATKIDSYNSKVLPEKIDTKLVILSEHEDVKLASNSYYNINGVLGSPFPKAEEFLTLLHELSQPKGLFEVFLKKFGTVKDLKKTESDY